MENQSVWITGGRGFIGRHLGRHLAQAGHPVSGLGHGLWPDAEAWGFHHWLNGSVAPDGLQTLAALSGFPAAIVHLAGGSSVGASLAAPAEDFRRTVASTHHLLEWVRLASPETRVVYVSSAAIYGARHDGPIPESALADPSSPYGVHKKMGEDLVASYAAQFGLSASVIRLFSVYGPGLRKQLLWDLCRRLQGGQRPLQVSGTGSELRDWLHIDDATRLIEILALQAPGGQRVNGGTGLGTTIRAVATRLAESWDPGTEVVFTGDMRPGDPRSLVADVTESRALGFSPSRPWGEGIDAFVQWFKSAEGTGP